MTRGTNLNSARVLYTNVTFSLTQPPYLLASNEKELEFFGIDVFEVGKSTPYSILYLYANLKIPRNLFFNQVNTNQCGLPSLRNTCSRLWNSLDISSKKDPYPPGFQKAHEVLYSQ